MGPKISWPSGCLAGLYGQQTCHLNRADWICQGGARDFGSNDDLDAEWWTLSCEMSVGPFMSASCSCATCQLVL
ncbi:hypothetical protein GQ44DRAFT_704469 [Phaeosphaeriaceae sp. PMI808]|nr:hypothetical protein GQ44DRAFT_704469 [Phaeosphaeriaceae sp. PMI808]